MHEGEADLSVFPWELWPKMALGTFPLYNYFFTFQHLHTPYNIIALTLKIYTKYI